MSSFQLFNEQERESLRRNGKILRGCLEHVASLVRPGISTKDLDKAGETYIRDHGGVPGFKGYNDYPSSLCLSVNEECVHGLPGKRILKDGDILSIDGGVILDGLNTDACITVPVGSISSEAKRLLRATQEALDRAVELVRPGTRVGDLSSAIQKSIEGSGCTPVEDLTGHGLGTHLHQFPEIPNRGRRGSGAVLPAWTLIAIEPIVTLGNGVIRQLQDGWTIITADGTLAAHCEHTILTTENGMEIIA